MKRTHAPDLTPIDLSVASVAPLRWQPESPRPRATFYLEWQDMRLTGPDGTTMQLDGRSGAAAVLDAIAPEGWNVPQTVYIVTGRSAETAPAEPWYYTPTEDGWAVDFRAGSCDVRSAVYRRGRQRVDVRHTAAWWDECRSVRLMRSAHTALEKRLQRDFAVPGCSSALFGTPAQTGLHLLTLALPRRREGGEYIPYEYPVLGDELREFFRPVHEGGRVTYQHRRDLIPSEASDLPRFFYRDGRLAYGACVREVPTGLPVHDDVPDLEPHRPGWYRCTFTVSRGWRHIGLVRAIPDDVWPARGGERFTAWVSEPELRLVEAHSDWRYEIHERLLFASTSTPGADPLRGWSEKLRRAYLDACRLPDAELRPLLKAAVRHLLLDPLGAFGRRHGVRTYTIPFGSPLPMAFEPQRTPYGWQVSEPQPIPPDRLRYCQPHWLAHIWAKQRANLARVALVEHAAGSVVGFRTDALYTTTPPPIHDSGAIGEYRLKGWIPAPRPYPRTQADLAHLADEAEQIADA